MLWPIIIAIIFTIVVFIFYKYEKSNSRWNRKAALLQTIGVVWALVFAVYSIQSANNGTNATINEINRLFSTSKKLSDQFEKLSSNLSSMPKQLESFSNKLIILDSTIGKQQKNISSNLENIRNTIADFNKSIFTYKNSIDDYSSQLSKIVSATESQLVIWKEQQSIVKKEYSRRSVLTLAPTKCLQNDSTFTIEGIKVINDGDIEANLIAIVLIVNTNDVISFDNQITKKTGTVGNDDYFQIDFSNLYPKQISQHDKINYSDFKITLKVNKELKKTTRTQYYISYKINYQSQYSSEPFYGFLYCQ